VSDEMVGENGAPVKPTFWAIWVGGKVLAYIWAVERKQALELCYSITSDMSAEICRSTMSTRKIVNGVKIFGRVPYHLP